MNTAQEPAMIAQDAPNDEAGSAVQSVTDMPNLEYLLHENRRQSIIEDAARELLCAMHDYDPRYPEESLVPDRRAALEQALYPRKGR